MLSLLTCVYKASKFPVLFIDIVMYILYQIQGKGTVVTYFLTGKDGFNKELPSLIEVALLAANAGLET